MYILNKAKKSLGQNFLFDENIINKIINIADINENKIIVEIGSGYGNLTQYISKKKPKKIYAIEKDKKLCLFLKKKFILNKNVEVINEDILNIIQKDSLEKNIIIFGNLPYNISTKILASLTLLEKWPPWYDVMILMFQKEVADRIIAKTQTKEYGRLAVLSNWRLEVKKHFDVSKNCFFPKPKINSSVLSFRPKKKYTYKLNNPKSLEKITRVLFSNRRKMINKNLKKLFKEKLILIKNVNINMNKRPEELNNETFYKLAVEYEKLFS